MADGQVALEPPQPSLAEDSELGGYCVTPLNLLAQQGKVEAAFHEGGEDGPYLLYRAIDPAGAPPQI